VSSMLDIEKDITELATHLWVSHRRHDSGRRPPSSEDLGLNLYWTGNRWYASISRWPARTPGRRIGVYASHASTALTSLLAKLRKEG